MEVHASEERSLSRTPGIQDRVRTHPADRPHDLTVLLDHGVETTIQVLERPSWILPGIEQDTFDARKRFVVTTRIVVGWHDLGIDTEERQVDRSRDVRDLDLPRPHQELVAIIDGHALEDRRIPDRVAKDDTVVTRYQPLEAPEILRQRTERHRAGILETSAFVSGLQVDPGPGRVGPGRLPVDPRPDAVRTVVDDAPQLDEVTFPARGPAKLRSVEQRRDRTIPDQRDRDALAGDVVGLHFDRRRQERAVVHVLPGIPRELSFAGWLPGHRTKQGKDGKDADGDHVHGDLVLAWMSCTGTRRPPVDWRWHG